MQKHIEYRGRVVWTGNTGAGTSDYTGYSRAHDIIVSGKPVIAGTADPAFAGDAALHNPEDLFIAAAAACHMLFYLSLCARHGIVVIAYEDRPHGVLAMSRDGGGRFERITLAPVVTIAPDVVPGQHDGGSGDARRGGAGTVRTRGDDRPTDSEARAFQLHATAHDLCFIANSCSVPLRLDPVVRTAVAIRNAQAPA